MADAFCIGCAAPSLTWPQLSAGRGDVGRHVTDRMRTAHGGCLGLRHGLSGHIAQRRIDGLGLGLYTKPRHDRRDEFIVQIDLDAYPSHPLRMHRGMIHAAPSIEEAAAGGR